MDQQSKITKEQLDDIKASVKRDLKLIVGVAKQYGQAYPPKLTPPEVMNAITVAVPYPVFMSLAALAIASCTTKQEESNNG